MGRFIFEKVSESFICEVNNIITVYSVLEDILFRRKGCFPTPLRARYSFCVFFNELPPKQIKITYEQSSIYVDEVRVEGSKLHVYLIGYDAVSYWGKNENNCV